MVGYIWGRRGEYVDYKWGWIIYGLFVYKLLTGCGYSVDFTPINSPHFLCPTKVK